MQDVDPDMDEIFKEAADKYPLKTNTAGWKAVSQKLYGKDNNDKSGISYNKRTWALLFLVLLILTGLIITQYLKAHKEQTLAGVENKHLKPSPNKKLGSIRTEDQPEQMNREIYPDEKEEYNENGKNNTTVSRNNSKVTGQNELTGVMLQNNNVHAYYNSNRIYLDKDLPDNLVKDKSIMFFENSNNKLSESSQNLNTPVEKNSTSSKNNKQVNSGLKRFYIGGVVAPELTSVKFQPVKRMSFNLGVLIGYRVSDKIGIELGATFAHKYYYTDGKYTAPKSIRYDNAKILNVDAFSSITEMPLTLQYNIKNNKNTRFFASAGCVSYVMHKEHYSYTYEKNGQEKHSVKYDNKASDYWFSNAQLGFGYEHSVNKIGNIVIEPYFRIPLKNVGISNLPITSIGINFALTKNLKN